MAEVDSRFVRKGYWINHSHGNVLGATWTVDQTTANLNVALLAIVVPLAAGALWKLVLFATYYFRAVSDPKDALYRQQQILFRSLSPPASTLALLVSLLSVWKGRAPRAWLRCLAPAIPALLIGCGGLIAAIFSSYMVSSADTEVLLNGRYCRLLNLSALNGAPMELRNTIIDRLALVEDTARYYTDQCFGSGPVPSRCKFYIHPRIEAVSNYTSCPFDPSICAISDHKNAAMSLDSGFVDSHDVLGINALLQDRVQVRKILTCAPLKVAEHTTVVNGSDPAILRAVVDAPLPGDFFWVFSYGKALFSQFQYLPNNGTCAASFIGTNITYSISTRGFGTKLDSEAPFDPIPALKRDDADVSLTFVSTHALASLTPIDDPVYASHREHSVLNLGVNRTRYWMDQPAGVIGCTEQYQYCILNSRGDRKCTALANSLLENLDPLLSEANDVQATLLLVIKIAIDTLDMAHAARMEPPFLDLMKKKLRGQRLYGVPNDQWTLDVRHIHDWSWAAARVHIVMYFTGWSNGSLPMFYEASTDAERQFCQSQKVVKAGGFANISVFGLCLTFSITLLLIIADYVLLTASLRTRWLQRILGPKLRFWIDDGVFQLQRMAYSAYGEGTWSRLDREVPQTAAGETFRDLASYAQLANTNKPASQTSAHTSQSISFTTASHARAASNAAPVAGPPTNANSSSNAPPPPARATATATNAGTANNATTIPPPPTNAASSLLTASTPARATTN